MTTKKSTAKMNERPPNKSSDELVIENFETLTRLVESLSKSLDMLVQKTESMAFHIIATEAILAEIVSETGLNISRVNARIRAKIALEPDNMIDANTAIDVAASIASPLPRR